MESETEKSSLDQQIEAWVKDPADNTSGVFVSKVIGELAAARSLLRKAVDAGGETLTALGLMEAERNHWKTQADGIEEKRIWLFGIVCILIRRTKNQRALLSDDAIETEAKIDSTEIMSEYVESYGLKLWLVDK